MGLHRWDLLPQNLGYPATVWEANEGTRSAINHEAAQMHILHFRTNSINAPPTPAASTPLLVRFHLLIAKAFWHGNVFVKKRGLNLGHLSKEDTGTRTLLQLISKCFATAFGQRIDLHKAILKMNLSPPLLPTHSPCPASVRRAPGFQIGSVSYDNQIRDESLRGLPRERDGGKGGDRTVCQPGRRMDCTEMGSLSPTLLGRHMASNKGKKENPGPHSFDTPPPHTHTPRLGN